MSSVCLHSVHTQLRLTGGATKDEGCCGKRDCDHTETWRDGPLHTSALLCTECTETSCEHLRGPCQVCVTDQKTQGSENAAIRKRNQNEVQGRGACRESRRAWREQGGGENNNLGAGLRGGWRSYSRPWAVHD
jgi:hypothetical protein